MRIVFVCQAGEIEAKSILLAASLRHHLNRSVALIAAVPKDPMWGEVAGDTLGLLDQLEIRRVHIEQPFGMGYPTANKIAALSAAGATPALLLDSDVLCFSPPPFHSLGGATDIAGKPVDLLAVRRTEEEWKEIYETVGIRLPRLRLRTTLSDEVTPPYLNAGVLYVRDAEKFGNCWMEVCRRIDCNPRIRNTRPWLDQLGLPVASEILKWNLRCLTDSWNFPAHLCSLDRHSADPPLFVHYHQPSVIAGAPLLSGYVRRLVSEYPLLSAYLDCRADWRSLL